MTRAADSLKPFFDTTLLWIKNYVDDARNRARVIPWLHSTGILLVTDPTAKPPEHRKTNFLRPIFTAAPIMGITIIRASGGLSAGLRERKPLQSSTGNIE